MLEGSEEQSQITPSPEAVAMNTTTRTEGSTSTPSLLDRMLRIEWLGQTVASLSWIASVFAYGITGPGDWLQLLAASSWLVANIAAVGAPTPD
ncbi:MAG: hypothetical protein ACPGXK_15425 [Phycisphaerae bacterium]